MAVDKADKVDKVDKGTPAESEATKFNLSAYIKETRAELEKVIWPTRQQLISESAAVFLMVVLSATFIYLIDALFSTLAKLVFR